MMTARLLFLWAAAAGFPVEQFVDGRGAVVGTGTVVVVVTTTDSTADGHGKEGLSVLLHQDQQIRQQGANDGGGRPAIIRTAGSSSRLLLLLLQQQGQAHKEAEQVLAAVAVDHPHRLAIGIVVVVFVAAAVPLLLLLQQQGLVLGSLLRVQQTGGQRLLPEPRQALHKALDNFRSHGRRRRVALLGEASLADCGCWLFAASDYYLHSLIFFLAKWLQHFGDGHGGGEGVHEAEPC